MILKSLLILVAGVLALRSYLLLARRFHIVDVPNERSSHSRQTLRGGGIIFFPLPLLLALSHHDLLAMAFASTAIAAVGFLDDLRGVSATTRLAVHIAAALAVLLASEMTGVWFALGMFVIAFATNTFNFIDGIDGILAGMSLAGTLWLAVLFCRSPLAIYLTALIPLLLAFLLFNWQPARVFMGDVGSGFLGFSIASATLLSSPTLLRGVAGLSLAFAPLFGDATLTLLARLIRGENIFRAHRCHAYQKLSLAWQSHAKVSTLYSIYVLGLSGPLAFLADRYSLSYLLAFIMAYVPILLIWGYAELNDRRDSVRDILEPGQSKSHPSAFFRDAAFPFLRKEPK